MANRPRVVFLVSALAALGLLVWAVRGHSTVLQRVDLGVLRRLNHATAPRPGLVSFWRGVSTTLQPLTFQTAAVLAGAVLASRHRVRAGLFVVVTVIGAGLLSTVVKNLVDRPRPQPPVVLATARGQSFPSGHALASATTMTVAGVLAWLGLAASRAVVVTAVGAALALLVAASRLFLGVHYLSDVLGAWLIAAAWVAATATVFGVTASALREPRTPASV